MNSIKWSILIPFLFAFVSPGIHAQGLKAFKLPNGLNVFVWEDATVPEVFGMIAVNAGSKEEPEEYTGLAHYLEHLLFKGTDKIGSLDWEREKPLYEQIIAKYDDRAATTDPVLKEAISKEINELSLESSKYSLSNEFSAIVQGMGGNYLNAFTSYDMTTYFNKFPPGEIYKWLQLYSERLLHPVFRSFQYELETVYEEYNRSQDQAASREREFIFDRIFEGHPYARPVIGLQEHLKNPQLSQVHTFFNHWYVPDNMVLVLVGNVKTNEIVPLVKETFGRLERRPVPDRKVYPENPLKGRKEASAKVSQYPQVMLAFPGITAANEDAIAVEICTSILSNSNRTGLIDKLEIDGDMLSTGAYELKLKERGYLLISAVPYYDASQRRFESLKSTENALLKEIKKLQEGKFDDLLVQSVKSDLIRRYDLQMESRYSPSGYDLRAVAIAEQFFSGKDMGELLNYKELVAAVTTGQIKETAKKYFGPNYYALHLNEGKPAKTRELTKPELKPIEAVRGEESEYAKTFRLLPTKYMGNAFADMDEVKIKPINDRSKLFYTQNNENEIFTLTLKFGIGTGKMPKLELAAELMNNAGILGQMDAQAVKQEFSNLGASCRYFVDDSYLYVTLDGFETNLEASCNLLTRQILLPQLDEKQMNRLKGGYYQQRKIEMSVNEVISNALLEYLLYKDKSKFLDRLSLEEIGNLTISNLTGEFQRATDYEAQIHYVGTLPVDDVYAILSKNLPLKQGEKASSSPEIKDRVDYTENTVFFLPNSDAKQSTVYFYIPGDDYSKEQDPYREAFNEYFNGGFSGLVLQEIREYRSLAYTAGGYCIDPPVEHKKSGFFGLLGTQADKTLEAIEVYRELLNNMPRYPERLVNIKNFLKGAASLERPHYRNAGQVYEAWKRKGYAQSPAKTNLPVVDKLSFDDIVRFYNENVNGRPIAMAVVGNPKMIDEKALSKYGKVVRLSVSKVFSDQ
ncbi:MAG: insulinase family protein [Dysgonamonadaceae bacterium]|jgi:predicted Zn-dependent peptidase|nr:insulinase family protein [Dysgonamonadaceae bacterium]